RYFYPDTPPYASILRDIAISLGGNDMRVSILTCQPSYNRSVVSQTQAYERLADNVTVRRFGVVDDRRSTLLKIVNMVWFAVRILTESRRLGRVDAVMAASTPPIGIARAGLALARRKRAAF